MSTFQSSAAAPHSACASPLHLSSPLASAVPNSQHDYNFSPTSHDESSATEENHEYTDGEKARLNAGTSSSRSSISSLPASVAPSATVLPPDARTPTKAPMLHDSGVGGLSGDTNVRRWRASPFRNPSSVLNIQMQDEDDIIPHHHKRAPRTSRNISNFSARSSGSISQTKLRGGRDELLSPRSSKIKKEFPLVLLHCSLLPAVLPIKTRISDAALLQAVLPEEYWMRWELLTDKITNDLEVQSRGVLIPHPKADYELLEERLLESLELARPRLRLGHFYGHENVDEVEESESDADTAKQGTKCQDCGNRVMEDIARDRKWEVKVYAANGLMRAGAWAAAWNEMEKVDIEVSVCLPEEIRREVDERCLRLGAGPGMEADEVAADEPTDAERRRREIYGSPRDDPQEKVDGFFESSHPYDEVHQESFATQHHYQHPGPAPTIELKQLLINYVRVLAQDKRNVVIAILSFAVLFFAIGTARPTQQGLDWNLVPINVSITSSATTPQCTLSPLPSVSFIPALTREESTSTSNEPLTVTECGQPIQSTNTAVTLHASAPDSRIREEEFVHEVGLEI